MRVMIFSIAIIWLVFSGVAHAMTSTNFMIQFDSINSGGNDFGTSTNYQLNDTLGEQGTGYGTSTNYVLHAGYRQADETAQKSLSFTLGAQENETKVAYSGFSLVGKTVTVASVANFATSSFIGVVENEGLSQKFMFGRVTGINGLIMTVDEWEGTGSMSAVSAGGDDFVYRMDGHAIQLGTLNTATGKTGIVRTDVSTNAQNGYTLRIQTDGYLRTGPIVHISDVADGAVSAGSEEYGARTYGMTATSTGLDFAVSSTLRDIQISSTTAANDRIGMIYKAAINSGTPTGNYTQVVRYLLTANF